MTHERQLLNLATIEIVSIPAPIPNSINEDAWLVLEVDQSPGYVIAAVIDGAGARLSLLPLKNALDRYHHGITEAAFASELVRTVLIKQFAEHPYYPLHAALLKANDTLQALVTDYIGGFSSEYILNLAGEPAGTDPRRMRLALPACVVTLIRVNKTTHQLEYAHAGDTSLLEIRRNGDVIRHTTDQMGPYDKNALQLAVKLCKEQNLLNLSDVIKLPLVQQLNQQNGLWHNFVDEEGRTHPGKGCGVIDGLPELVDYLEIGTVFIDPQQIEGFCLLSDGLELLAPLDETSLEVESRLRQTGDIIRTKGLHGLFQTMQHMTQSGNFYQYPRMKFQDDATGIYLRFLNSR